MCGAKGRERRGNKVGVLIGPVADIDFSAGGIVLLKLISICHSLAIMEKIRNLLHFDFLPLRFREI